MSVVEAERSAVPARRGADPGWLHRVRLAAGCTALTALAMSQAPGQVAADTKLDLVVDPWRFLGRALQLWDATGFAGQVQNQAYGYLFPMGPFFGIGQALQVPTWVLQRSWLALLLCLAFTGTVQLAGALGLGRPGSRLLAGLAYALAPRMLSTLGAVSVEVLPMALAPWVLVPLVVGAVRGPPRRAGLLAGLLVGCVGGVNAAATAAVLPLPVLWLLTRPRGPRRARLAGWWVLGVVLSTAWWVLPLLLLGRYSPPFLDLIETAGTTTGPTELAEVFRGTSQWLAHLTTGRGPVWPAGWELVHDAAAATATVALAALGVAALVARRLPHRRFLVLGALTGLALVGAGHLGDVQGLAAGPLHAALDGVLAPLRNVHKADPVLRLPLALALADLAGRALLGVQRRARRGHRRRRQPGGSPLVVVLVVGALLGVALPALQLRVVPPTGSAGLPDYWQDTATWLADQPAGRALVVPGSSSAVYVWGDTGDEPLQPLATSDWEVRNAVPLTPTAHIRALDVVEQVLATGEASEGLAAFLARSGIGYLVFRGDLDAAGVDAARPGLVQRALRDSPGLRRVAVFGPELNTDTAVPGLVLDAGLTPVVHAVEVWAVTGAAPTAWTQPLSSAATVLGGPDAVGQLLDRDLLDGSAALAVGEGEGPVLVGDALQRRERAFGRIDDATSAALSADDPLRLDGPVADYAAGATSVVRYTGGQPAASSSRSDAGNLGGSVPADQPYAALDGDPATAWRPAAALGAEEDSWWSVTADDRITASSVTLQLADPATDPPPDSLVLSTDAGSVTVPLRATTAPQTFDLPAGGTRVLRIAAPTGSVLALAEVAVPGLQVRRTVVLPSTADAVDPLVDVWALDATGAPSAGCTTVGQQVRCSPALVSGAEEPVGLDRTLPVAVPADYTWTASATPRAGAALDALIAATGRAAGADGEPVLVATASSTAVPDPRSSADAVVDGTTTTAWRAATGDTDTTLTVSWGEQLTVDRIQVVGSPQDGSTPTVVSIDDGSALGPRTARVEADGTVRFAPVTTDHLDLRFALFEPLSSYDPYDRASAGLGIAVAEVLVPGTTVADPGTPVQTPCGSGPDVVVDGQPVPTSTSTTLGRLRALQPVQLQPCGSDRVTFDAGEHSVVVGATDTLRGSSATLTRVGAGGAAVAGEGGERTELVPRTWTAERRVLPVAARTGPQLLVVPENTNPGWVAELDGQRLAARTVDGWQQGWVLPAGAAGVVTLTYEPGGLYRAALLTGAGTVVVLLVLLALPVRRSVPPERGSRWSARNGWVLAVAAGLVGLIGGWIGLGVLAVLGAGHRVLRRRRGDRAAGRLLVVAGAGGVLVSGAALLFGVPGGGEGARQAWALVAVAALALAVSPARTGAVRDRSRTSPRNRWAGLSTSRQLSQAQPVPASHTNGNTTPNEPVSGSAPSSS